MKNCNSLSCVLFRFKYTQSIFFRLHDNILMTDICRYSARKHYSQYFIISKSFLKSSFLLSFECCTLCILGAIPAAQAADVRLSSSFL